MRAWVEWHFADFGRLKSKGRSFICSKCKEEIQNTRKCNEDSWDVRGLSSQIPIELLEFSAGHNFCPAKLFRDDYEFVLYLEGLFVAWETGQTPEGMPFSLVDEETIQDLYNMITLWKRTERENDFMKLGHMLCGDKKSGS